MIRLGFLTLVFFKFCDCCNAICTFKNSANSPHKWAVAVSGFLLLCSASCSSSPYNPLVLHPLVCPQQGGQAGEAGSAETRLSGSEWRSQRSSSCFSRDKMLYFLRISDLEIFHCLKLQELVINPIIVVDFAAVTVSRNKKNCSGSLCFARKELDAILVPAMWELDL